MHFCRQYRVKHCYGPMASQSLARASDKGFTWMSAMDYLEFLDALARNVRPDKKGRHPDVVLDLRSIES